MEDDAQREAEYAAAEEKFGAAVRAYLWELVRISGSPEWEDDLDFVLLAVARAALQEVGYRFQPGTGGGADLVLQETIAGLAEELLAA